MTCKEVEVCQLRSPQSQFNCVNGAVNVPATEKRDVGEEEWTQPEDCHTGLMTKFFDWLKVEPGELKRLMVRHRGVEGR